MDRLPVFRKTTRRDAMAAVMKNKALMGLIAVFTVLILVGILTS